MNFLPFLLILVSSFLQGHVFAAKKVFLYCNAIFAVKKVSSSQCSTPYFLLQSYVVYIGGHSNQAGRLLAQSDEHVRQTHLALLRSHLKSKELANDAIFYSYTRHINGFAAMLDEEVALAISNSPKVISVFENKRHKLHTTRSWQFLGLERDGEIPQESLWRKAKFGEDVIIGNIDSGMVK
ncbi:hypothetical protein HPP92_027536 [Vanilla planifolia]|uniref:Inhibitor I9 domain-containing protein n=1 Tax=Vanilla planifolia TaxID=51239 RepID=A0A835U4C1_VANPL|nr:hypothetical protein HPP92_027536 [Vanilla planifolia]